MVRRILVMVVACAVFGGALAMAGRAEKEGYTLMPATDTMSTSELTEALGALGLHVERFAYDVPVKHDLRLRVDEYRSGKLTQSVLDMTASDLTAGTHRLLVFARQTGGGMQFSFANNGGGGSSNAVVSLKGLRTMGWRGPDGKRLVVGQRMELGRFYGDKANRRSTADGDLKAALAAHDVVVTITATLSTP